MTGLLAGIGVAPAWLAARDPRLRILGALGIALVTVSLNSVGALLAALAGVICLALAAGIDLGRVLSRLLALEGFMLLLLVLLPFSVPGETLFVVGYWPASREGAWLALQILIRANTIVIVLLALLGTLEPAALGHALSQLRLPDKLVHLFLFTVRYVDVLHIEYRRLRGAMRARAFVARSDAHTWRSLGWLIGMLLVRSLERAQRVQAAMKCRGFQGRFYLLDTGRWQGADSATAIVLIGALGALLLLEHLA